TPPASSPCCWGRRSSSSSSRGGRRSAGCSPSTRPRTPPPRPKGLPRPSPRSPPDLDHPVWVTSSRALVHKVTLSVGARKDTSGSRPRVLVLGGGFAGIGAAQKLRKSDVDVVLVDGHDYHTFQPLLYQVATGLLEQPAVGHPIRDLVHEQENARVHQDTVTAIDLDARGVRFSELVPLTYDYLVFGLGAEVNFFGVDGAQE